MLLIIEFYEMVAFYLEKSIVVHGRSSNRANFVTEIGGFLRVRRKKKNIRFKQKYVLKIKRIYCCELIFLFTKIFLFLALINM